MRGVSKNFSMEHHVFFPPRHGEFPAWHCNFSTNFDWYEFFVSKIWSNFLIGTQQKIYLNNQYVLNATRAEFLNNFSTRTAKREQFLIETLTVTYPTVFVRQDEIFPSISLKFIPRWIQVMKSEILLSRKEIGVFLINYSKFL